MRDNEDKAHQRHQTARDIDNTLAPETIREPASRKGAGKTGQRNQNDKIGRLLLRMRDPHHIAHIVLQKSLNRINTQHHEQTRDKHPGKIWIAARIEVKYT